MRTENRSHSRLMTAALLAAALAPVAMSTTIIARAQEPPPPQAVPPPQEPRPGPPINRELAEAMQELMLQRLEVQLELSDDQKKTVLPLVRDLSDLRREHNQSRREALRTVNVMAQDAAVDEASLSRRLEIFYKEQEDFREQETKLVREIRSHLNPRQQARLLQFEERFRNEMRRRIDDARRRGGPRGRGERLRPGDPPRP